MSPCKSDTPHLWIIKDKLGDKRYEQDVGFYFHISYWYKYGATYILLKQTLLSSNNILSSSINIQQAQATKCFEVQATNQSVAVFKLFFVDAINWKFLYLDFYFVRFIRAVVNF